MKSTYALITFLLMLICVSCKPTYNDITEEEFLEYQIYGLHEELNFVNTFGQTEIYKIITVRGGYDEDGDTYNERVIDGIVKLSDTVKTNYYGYYRFEKDGSDLLVSFKWPHHALVKNVTAAPKIPIYVFNGDTLYNICISTVPSILIDSTHSYIDSVYFSKELGIFKFTDIYNNTWTKTN